MYDSPGKVIFAFLHFTYMYFIFNLKFNLNFLKYLLIINILV